MLYFKNICFSLEDKTSMGLHRSICNNSNGLMAPIFLNEILIGFTDLLGIQCSSISIKISRPQAL